MGNLLLPCPNCDSENGGQIVGSPLGYYVRCWDCGLEHTKYWQAEDMAALAWNKLARKSGKMPKGEEVLYAGLDTDGILKIFTIGPDERPRHVDHQHWLGIRAARLPGIEAGEMPVVSLRLEKKKEKQP